MFWSTAGFALGRPGKYRVNVAVSWSARGVAVGVENGVDVFVDYPTSDADNNAASLVMHADVGKWVALGGEAYHLRRGGPPPDGPERGRRPARSRSLTAGGGASRVLDGFADLLPNRSKLAKAQPDAGGAAPKSAAVPYNGGTGTGQARDQGEPAHGTQAVVMATNFDLAPPPVSFDGKTAVPIDISTIDARLTFDGATSTASGEATLTFVVGPVAGRPMFDLRQNITGVWLDGAPLAVGQVLTRDLGGGSGAELRVLDVSLAAGSSHTLRFTYNVALPASPAGGSYPPGLAWSAGPRLVFNFGFTDLAAARYLEAWVPANLIWDQYAVDSRAAGDGHGDRAQRHHQRRDHVARHEPLARRVSRSDHGIFHAVEVRATNTLATSSTTVTLPVSGKGRHRSTRSSSPRTRR